VFPLRARGKEPITAHGCKDATTDERRIRQWWTKNPDANIGVATGLGLVVLDVDDKPDNAVQGSDSLREWEVENGDLAETCRAITGSGGVHYFFDVGDADVPNSASAELAIDVRGDGGYVVVPPSVHPNGNEYVWDISPEDTLPAKVGDVEKACIQWAHDHGNGSRRTGSVQIPDRMIHEGEGRNTFLYEQGCSIRGKGADDELVASWLETMNARKCVPPVDDGELSTIIVQVCKLPVGMSDEAMASAKAKAEKKKAGRPRKFAHNEVARRLIDERGACLIDGTTPAIRDDEGRYRLGWDAFDDAIIGMHDDCTINNRREAKAYILARAPHRQQSPWNLIAFENGVLDVLTMELREYRDDDIIPNVIPHRWNPHARSDLLNRTFAKMACGDMATQMNLAEFIGICMIRSTTRMPYYPVLIGTGANGKSTYIKMLKAILGPDNISAMQPKDLCSKFLGAHIVGKMANLGDDIAAAYLDEKDCSVIKSVATGDLMFTDVKGGTGYYFEPYCTMVFSCNQFPRCADTTDGFMRRLFPVEFNAVFSPDDPDYDPDIGTKLLDEETLEYACVAGVEGLRRAISNNQPTPNKMTDIVKGDIARENNTGLQWFNDAQVKLDDVVGKTKEEVYSEYSRWCERNGYERTRMGSGKLSTLIGTYFRVSCTRTSHRNFTTGRKTVKVYEAKRAASATRKAQVDDEK